MPGGFTNPQAVRKGSRAGRGVAVGTVLGCLVQRPVAMVQVWGLMVLGSVEGEGVVFGCTVACWHGGLFWCMGCVGGGGTLQCRTHSTPGAFSIMSLSHVLVFAPPLACCLTLCTDV
jgi:hypothetical protein